ncbi:MAG: hypothetical protein KF709_12500 [Gemmatimonadaceae bacterium]|nr:hypothetical protein [Gemmatimonadaceae bacterium]
MRRVLPIGALLLAVVVAGACRRSTGGGDTGTRTSPEAVVQFLDAARARDLDQMSAVWGNAARPTRDEVSRQELEQRLLVMICLLRHDESRLGVASPGEAGRQVYRVELKQGDKLATTTFTTVQNARTNRWFVEEFDPRPLRDFCSSPNAPVRPGSGRD